MSDFGKRRQVPSGQIVVQEGDLSGDAYRIVSGSVVVYKITGGHPVPLARLGPGEFFGEMSLILDTPRTASVRALEDTVLDVFDQDTLNRTLVESPQRMFPLLRILFERLRVMNLKFAHAIESQRQVEQAARRAGLNISEPEIEDLKAPGATIIVEGDTEVTRRLVGPTGLEITKLPFRFGRQTAGLAPADAFNLNDVHIPDRAPFNVSRNHCAIDLDDAGAPVLADRGSTLGTIVNGTPIGVNFSTVSARLDVGANAVALGRPSAPFRFTVTVEPH